MHLMSFITKNFKNYFKMQKKKLRKKLINIDLYSSLWTSVVSSYILHLQNGSLLLDIEDILAMARTLTDELQNVIKIEMSAGMKDFKEMKGLNLLENVETKDKK